MKIVITGRSRKGKTTQYVIPEIKNRKSQNTPIYFLTAKYENILSEVIPCATVIFYSPNQYSLEQIKRFLANIVKTDCFIIIDEAQSFNTIISESCFEATADIMILGDIQTNNFPSDWEIIDLNK